MALTPVELEQIKDLLDTQKRELMSDTKRRINRLERTQKAQRIAENSNLQSGLQKQFNTEIHAAIQTSEHNLKQLLQKRFDYLDGALENVTGEIIKIQGELHTNHEERIQALARTIHNP